MNRFIRGLINVKSPISPCVLAIGNFDGVHLGHQMIIKQLKEKSKCLGLPTAILFFEPQPNEFFMTKQHPRLTCFRDKLQLFMQHGIDYIICLKFNHKLAIIDAEHFVQDILADKLNVRLIVIGEDFCFGYKRKGNYQLLCDLSQRLGFKVDIVSSYQYGDKRVSSTLIRQALLAGDIATANQLLGYAYKISGRVQHGEKRGQQLGFPTANLRLSRYQLPLSGIFSAHVLGLGEPKNAVVYIGNRPVYDGQEVLIEVHIFDYQNDIYGQSIQVEFLQKIRDDQNFGSEIELLEQIKQDIIQAKASCNQHITCP